MFTVTLDTLIYRFYPDQAARRLITNRKKGADVPAAIDRAFAPLIQGNEVTTDLGAQLYQIAKLIARGAGIDRHHPGVVVEPGLGEDRVAEPAFLADALE